MSVLQLASVLISLLCFSAAAPTTDDCSQQTQPRPADELHQILGRWTLIEGFTDNEHFEEYFVNSESIWMALNTTSDSNTLVLDEGRLRVSTTDLNSTLEHRKPVKDRCTRAAKRITLNEDKFLEFQVKHLPIYFKFLQTCNECVLMYIGGNYFKALFLLGRNTTLPVSDLETTRKQAACLQIPLPAKFHYNPNPEFCPV